MGVIVDAAVLGCIIFISVPIFALSIKIVEYLKYEQQNKVLLLPKYTQDDIIC